MFLCYSQFSCSYTTQVYKHKQHKTITEIYRMEKRRCKKLELIVVKIDREKDWEKLDGQHRDKQKEMRDKRKSAKIKKVWYKGTDRKTDKI